MTLEAEVLADRLPWRPRGSWPSPVPGRNGENGLSKMVTVMSKMVAMMAVRNGGDALGYGDDDGNDAMAVRLMTAMMAMTLWKMTFP